MLRSERKSGSLIPDKDTVSVFLSRVKNTEIAYRQNGVFVQNVSMAGETTVLFRARKEAGMSRPQLAELAGTSAQQIEKLEKGVREMTRTWAERLAPHLGVTAEFLVFSRGRTTSVVGYAAAGNDTVTFADAQGPLEEVDAPQWATKDTVAVRVRGTSLGIHFDNWLAFYDDRRDPPDQSLIGELCICGLPENRVVIKKLRAGSIKGKFHLESNTEPTMFDQVVEWAAMVSEMRPR